MKSEDEAPPVHKGVYLLPSLVTTIGLFAGFFSIVSSVNEDYRMAAIAILVANVCDIVDGRIARLTRTSTRFGVEYDSLSDVIAFGVAPGLLVYCWALRPWGAVGWLAASMFVACGALRLARFNAQYDNAEKRHFLGLPIPAAAEVIASLVLLYFYFGGEGETHKRVTILLTTYGLALLMVSSFKYFSFKETDMLRRQPFWSLVGLVFLLALIIAMPPVMLFLGFGGYAVSAPLRWAWVQWRLRSRRGRGPKNPLDPPSEPPRPLTVVGGKAAPKAANDETKDRSAG